MMRTEQTALNIGRIKSFDEVMQEVGMPCENSEELQLAKLKEMLATYEDLCGIILPSRAAELYLLNWENGEKLTSHNRSR